MDKDVKNKLATGAGIILIFGLFGWYWYSQGKKTTTLAALPVDDTTNDTQHASENDLTQLAASLYFDMKGINIFGHNVEPYQKAVNLSDYDFVRLYNIFNSKYQSETGETLGQWFHSETYLYVGNSSIYQAFSDKLDKLNLK